MSDTQRSDSVLIHEAGLGDEAAFVELYRRRQPDVFRFAYSMSKSAAVADDVVQEVFLNVLQNAARFDPARGSVRAWLLGCARYVLLDGVRRESRPAPESIEEPSAPCAGEQEVFERQRLGRLQAAILALPVEYREAIVLCELEELSYAECAAALGCPIGTIRSRLHRARTLLAARLGESEATEPGRNMRTSEVCS